MAEKYDVSDTKPSVREQQNETQQGINPATTSEATHARSTDTTDSNVRTYDSKGQSSSSLGLKLAISAVIFVIVLAILFFLVF